MKKAKKIILVSPSESGRVVLTEILRLGQKNVTVFTVNSGNEKTISGFCNFEKLSKKHGFTVYKINNINSTKTIEAIKEISPDVMFVIGWSRIVRPEVINIPRLGCVGFHPTLLPKNRGCAPIPWTLINALKESGATLFYLDKGVDSGPIIDQRKFNITFKDDASSVYDKAVDALRRMIRKNLKGILDGSANAICQDESKTNYWPRRKPKDGIIDWAKSSRDIYNWIRALTKPYPGAFTYFKGKKIIIWKADMSSKRFKSKPINIYGIVVNIDKTGYPIISCGRGYIKLLTLEIEPKGKKVKFMIGDRLGA